MVQENAYTREGRNKVATQYSLLSSIEGTAASEWVVGTRYDPRDLYNDMMDMKEEVYDDKGDITDMRNVYEKFERQVEDRGLSILTRHSTAPSIITILPTRVVLVSLKRTSSTTIKGSYSW